MKPLASALITTFDGEAFVGETIESVLRQRHAPLEVIVCDDGSRDGTIDVLRSFGRRITLLEEARGGVSAARNRAAAAARGDYLAFLDQDDLWEPEMLGEQIARLERHPEWGLVYADSWIIDARGRRHGRRSAFLDYATGNVFERLVRANFIPIETMVLPRRVFLEVGGFDPRLCFVEDLELCLRIAARYPIGFDPRPLASYRIHDRNLSHRRVDLLAEWVQVLEELSQRLEGAPARLLARQLSRRRAELAWQHLRRMELAAADALLARAAPLRPLPLRLRVEALRRLLAVLPAPWRARVLALLPRRRLYGLPSQELEARAPRAAPVNGPPPPP